MFLLFFVLSWLGTQMKLQELIEDYDELAALLVEKGWLSHVEPLPFS